MRAALATGLALLLLAAGLALAWALRGGRGAEAEAHAAAGATVGLEGAETAALRPADAPLGEADEGARGAGASAAPAEPALAREEPIKASSHMRGAGADAEQPRGALAGRILHDLARMPSNLELRAEFDLSSSSDPALLALAQDGAFEREPTPEVLAVLERVLAESSFETVPKEDGTFSFPRLRAGSLERYSIVVWLKGAHEPLLSFPGIAIAPAGLTEPSELNPLDLRGRLAEARVQVTDLTGAPIPATVWFRGSGESEDAWRDVEHRPGRPLTLAVGAPALDLRAAAPGLRMQTQEGATGDVSFALSAGFPFVLRLRQTPALAPGVTLGVMLQAADSATAEPVPRQQWFDASGSCEFTAPGAATYRALLMFSLDAVGGGFHLLSDAPCAELRIPDESGATVSLDVPQAEVDATYRRLLEQLEQELKRPVELKDGLR